MKLLARYNRVNIVIALIILLLSNVTYYYILKGVLTQQSDNDLKVEEEEIIDFVKKKNQLPNASSYNGQQIFFTRPGTSKLARSVASATFFNKNENREEPARVLNFPVELNGILYKATVIKSQVKSEELLRLIALITGTIFLLLLLLIAVINRFVLNKIWKPFYATLNQLRQFNLKNARPINLPVTNLSEFDQLNTSVTEMTGRAVAEFESLKAFTDNASHEMQTPLAIINSKLDLLIQNSAPEQAEQLQAIYNASERLSKLNRTLLLLTRIENRQYMNKDMVDLGSTIEQKFQQFEDLIVAKNIKVTTNLEKVNILLNKELTDILLNNLVSNAIKHNCNNGYIQCALTQQKLLLINNGKPLSFDKKDIFKRFKKSDHSDGTGLGLSVVKQICDLYKFEIQYLNDGDEHTFIINF
jgi:signal transduction histidine kinase